MKNNQYPEHLFKTFKKHVNIIKKGETSDSLYWIISGHIKNKDSKTGKQLISKGEFFGTVSVLLQMPSQYTYEAESDVELIQFGKEDFYKYIFCIPDMVFALGKSLALQIDRETISYSKVASTKEGKKNYISFDKQDKEWNIITGKSKTHQIEVLEAEDFLIQEGKNPKSLFIIIEGAFEISKKDKVIAERRRKGECLGEVSLFLGVPHIASVKAVEPSKVIRIGLDKMDMLITESPKFSETLLKIMAERIQELYQ